MKHLVSGALRGAPKIFSYQKPHLLINDSFPGIVVAPGVSGCT